MGNEYSNKMLDAIEIIANSTANKLRFDRTVAGKISQVVNLEIGEYRAAIDGAEVVVYSLDVDKEYCVGDDVFIKIPEGDMTNKKYIDGKITNKKQKVFLSNAIEPFGLSWDYQKKEIGVSVGGDDKAIIQDNGEEDTLFTQYAKTATHLRIQAKFLTRFYESHSTGNYGLRLWLLTKSGTVSFKLDCSDFNGDPYHFINWAPQEIIIPIQSDFLTGIKTIELFQENFAADKPDQKHVLVKDISIQFVEIRDLTNYEYYLTYTSDGGTIFSKNEERITITPKLYSLGNLVSGKINYNLYKKVLSADSGWELQPLAAPFVFKEEDCFWKDEYLIVANYQGAISKKEFSLYNSTAQYDFEIRQIPNGDSIALEVFSNKPNGLSGITAKWYLTYPDGRLEFEKSGIRLDVRDLLNYTEIQFSCSLEKDDAIIGNLHWTIKNASSQNLTVIFEGDQAFNYDVNGDISAAVAETEKILECKLIWADGTGTGYSVKWIGPGGIQIGPSAAHTTNSMLDNLYIDENNCLHYSISRKYSINAIDNSVSIVITTVDGKEYEYKKDILFTKDGDPGTNGTSFTCSIVATQNKAWFTNSENNYELKAIVRKDGKEIYDGINYKWTGVNVSLNNTTAATISVDNITNGANEYYVKLEVNITGHTTIYSYFPIDVAYGLTSNIIDMSSVPSFVMYEASGLYPKYYSGELKAFYNNSLATQYVSTDSNLIAIDSNNTIRPAYKFNGAFKCGSIRCYFGNNSNYILRTVIMYINTYGNEAINGWDGRSIQNGNNYILAPQIGAGRKNNDNTFTGIVMGQDSAQGQIGLYGYNESGLTSFGLKADGTAFFGASEGGRIEINGNDAVIRGGTGSGSNSMILQLYNKSNKSSTNAININNGTFTVNYGGELSATGASVQGNIVATTGTIGCWGISSDGIRKGSTWLAADDEGTISTDTFVINDYGIIGKVDSFAGDAALGVADVRLDGTSIGKAIIIHSSDRARFSSDGPVIIQSFGETVHLYGDALKCNVPAENQTGIYARFA